MTNFATSLIRTFTPIIVGALVSWLITIGVDIDSDAQAGLIVGLTAVFQGAYYVIVRLIEKKFPQFGVLLGVATKPTYTK